MGAKVQYGYGTAATDVAEVTMISGPSPEFGEAETTHLGLTDPWKTFVPTLGDGGSLSFECNYKAATVTALNGILGKYDNGTAKMKWKITAPDEDGAGSGTAQTFTFEGFLKKAEYGNFEPEAVAKIKGEVKIIGMITVA